MHALYRFKVIARLRFASNLQYSPSHSPEALYEEMAARSIAYAHGIADGDKYCCYPWLVCHDIKSAMHPLLAQARPRMINHLTSNRLAI